MIGKSVVGSRSLQGMEFQYNHDLDVSEEFLTNSGRIRHALKDRRLLEAFESYKDQAALHKKWFERLGLISLVLGLLCLCLLYTSSTMLMGRRPTHIPSRPVLTLMRFFVSLTNWRRCV